MNETDRFKEYIQDSIINRLEWLMGNTEASQVNVWQKYGHVTKDAVYKQALHESMQPYYEMYLFGDPRLCRDGQHLESISRLMREIIADDDQFGNWASKQNLREAAEFWGDNLKRYDKEQRRIYRFFHVLELLLESGCRQDWTSISEELKEMLFHAEVCYDYKTDEVLCVLHGFVMIMKQEWTWQKKRELFSLLSDNWLFLKHYYSVMTRHIIGVKWTSFHKVAETVMGASQSFKPHMHIFYCGLVDCADELILNRRNRRELDKVVGQMQEELNRCEPSELLYELCDTLFPEDFQRLLREHRPKSYKEVEDESRRKDELIMQIKEQAKQLNLQLNKAEETLQQMVESAIPIKDVDSELEQYPSGMAWDLLQKLQANPVINMQPAWRENYPQLLEKYRARLFDSDIQQRNLTDAMMKVAERPTTSINATNYQPQIQSQHVDIPMPQNRLAE